MFLVFRTFMKKETTANIVAIACATLIFMLAHINFNLIRLPSRTLPSAADHLPIFGAFYGGLMVKTKSVVGPMLAHNLLNGVITLCSLLISLIF
jgi:membrane protease YdiL (CAAX protease family)